MKELVNEKFIIRSNEENKLVFLGYKDDSMGMNWIEGKEKWGTVFCPKGIDVSIEREFSENGNLREVYTFKNTTEFPISFKRTDIGIYTTFNDNYEETDICLEQKCHTHIFCGDNAAYIMALQMGGRAPHLGMKVIRGSIVSYSVKRDLNEQSNDRGDFILHPNLPILQPEETIEIEWELFWFLDKFDFRKKLMETYGFPVVNAKQFTYFIGETINFEVVASGIFKKEQIEIKHDGIEIHFEVRYVGETTVVQCEYLVKKSRELKFEINFADRKTHVNFLGCRDFNEMIEERCRFIVNKQQYHKEGSVLDGAYLIYDNEEKKQYYSHLDDHNGGRERIGMGILIARYLQNNKNEVFLQSLNKYIDYVYRELYDSNTGIVYNDVKRNLDWHRLYNYPWVSLFQLELYLLFKDRNYLKDSFRTMERYYKEGGGEFYGIAIPAIELLKYLKLENMKEEAEVFEKDFIKHASHILGNGLHYPPFEVRYEQSIVAPAVSCLIQAYDITKDKRFLEEAEKQMEVLELFNGQQPDYHQYEVAIRHWDGKWFGKYQNYGDTYPHYWSSLTGIDFVQYSNITGNKIYKEKAKASFRGCLSLFGSDGSASCAMVYPEMVNGKKGHYYDPWANDQDWALYFALRYEEATK